MFIKGLEKVAKVINQPKKPTGIYQDVFALPKTDQSTGPSAAAMMVPGQAAGIGR